MAGGEMTTSTSESHLASLRWPTISLIWLMVPFLQGHTRLVSRLFYRPGKEVGQEVHLEVASYEELPTALLACGGSRRLGLVLQCVGIHLGWNGGMSGLKEGETR